MRPRWPAASRWRLLLAAYVDYLLFGAVWALVVWVAPRVLPGFEREPLWVKLAIFAAVELFLLRVLRWSPGQRLLGILPRRRAAADRSDATAGEETGFVVEPRILASERWWTILIGVLLVLDASKALVRWTQFTPPAPWFGTVPTFAVAAVAAVGVGMVELWIAVGVLRLRRQVVFPAVALYGALAISALLSWRLWPQWAARYVEARRAFQGVPVRDGEVELMQAVAPLVSLGAPIIWLLAVFAVWLRLRRRPPGSLPEGGRG